MGSRVVVVAKFNSAPGIARAPNSQSTSTPFTRFLFMKNFQYFAHRPPSSITLLQDPLPELLRAPTARNRWPQRPLVKKYARPRPRRKTAELNA